jgi:hypothetical protein
MVSPLPVEAVRDLLGIARAMYGARKRQGVSEPELRELEEIGRKFKLALKLAQSTSPDTIGYRAARAHAEEAVSRLMALITVEMRLAPAVEAAVVRMRRRELPTGPGEERRRATKMRG